MNTITSRDQFKPLRIGEKLAVNYNKQLSVHVFHFKSDYCREVKIFLQKAGQPLQFILNSTLLILKVPITFGQTYLYCLP